MFPLRPPTTWQAFGNLTATGARICKELLSATSLLLPAAGVHSSPQRLITHHDHKSLPPDNLIKQSCIYFRADFRDPHAMNHVLAPRRTACCKLTRDERVHGQTPTSMHQVSAGITVHKATQIPRCEVSKRRTALGYAIAQWEYKARWPSGLRCRTIGMWMSSQEKADGKVQRSAVLDRSWSIGSSSIY